MVWAALVFTVLLTLVSFLVEFIDFVGGGGGGGGR